MKNNAKAVILAFLFCVLSFAPLGCIGRTGKAGKPIAERYAAKLEQLEVGKATPEDLKRLFGRNASLQSAQAGTETWEVFRGGNMDVGQFLMWGQIAHDKDQRMIFTFRNGRLSSWRSEVIPDPVEK
ncbi:MAG: hypothetical protein IIB53_13445 [Planctomycetes bacterium]|nr:hypothetical protein [Planctomycetota bacterium]MCH8259424.1 hypothetical protein [Planctomycetota bacterium]